MSAIKKRSFDLRFFLKRPLIQTFTVFASNSHVGGFMRGDIFRGKLKQVCVPGLNCYSCPGALASCPVGAFQSVVNSKKYGFSFYVSGMVMLFGVLFGRFICGFLCPFGFFQDLLHKIPLPCLKNPMEKEKLCGIPGKADKFLRLVKYAVLLVFVFLLPTFAHRSFRLVASPYFCKLMCPVGILQGAFPLIAKNESLRNILGFLFGWKTLFLLLTVLTSVFVYRPFCKYICPLGAFYALFNKISLYRMYIDTSKCTRCGKCEKVCRMKVPVIRPLKQGGKGIGMAQFLSVDNAECIRCHDCEKECPCAAISFGLKPHGEKLNSFMHF